MIGIDEPAFRWWGRRVRFLDAWGAPLPFGWRREREMSTDSYWIVPVWIFWLRKLRYVWWDFCRLAIRWGFLQGPEGETFASYHWSLKVWNGSYARVWGNPKLPAFHYPAARWYRFWRDRHHRFLDLHHDWRDRMPRWK